jgi:ribbon-helix-helix CopG family protein
MLDADQHRRLQLLSEARGKSMGSLIRESVSEYLAGTPASEDSIFGIIGMLDDHGPRPYGDVGEAHDLYLADAVAAEANRPRRVGGRAPARKRAARKQPKR